MQHYNIIECDKVSKEVRASQLAQASERVGSLIPLFFNPVVKLVLENQPFLKCQKITKGIYVTIVTCRAATHLAKGFIIIR